MKYLIASGWWSCPPSEDERDILLGDNLIRDTEFHTLWSECINRFTHPTEIMIVDSNSPIKPTLLNNEKWLEMERNFGHSTAHQGQFCGYSRAIFISMMYAYANDYDYWVYIEQDALIYGDQIIEQAIKQHPNSSIFYGSNQGNPQQPIQQSFMIFKREAIPAFIYHYSQLKIDDHLLNPEWKFLIAANPFARKLPLTFLIWLARPAMTLWQRAIRKYPRQFIRLFDRFTSLPFGYGRSRPLDMNQPYFYFQHGTKEEVETFKQKLAKSE